MLGRDGKTGEQVRHSPEVEGEEPADDPTATPVMPSPPFPAFQSVPTLPQQAPGVGFESGRDSRAR